VHSGEPETAGACAGVAQAPEMPHDRVTEGKLSP